MVDDQEMPQREKQLYWDSKANSKRYESVFDSYYNLDQQVKEYEQIKAIFKQNPNTTKMVDEKKNPINLKNAIFLLPGLDSLDQDLVKSMKTKEMRYP